MFRLMSVLFLLRRTSTLDTTENILTLQHMTIKPNLRSEKILKPWQYVDDYMLEYKMCKQPRFDNPIVVLQAWYDFVLPGASVLDNVYDQEIVEFNDCALSLYDARLDISKIRTMRKNFDKLRPNLRTIIFPARQESQTETLLAMIKRNLGAPQLQGHLDVDIVSNDMVNNFINTYIPKENRQHYINSLDRNTHE